MNANDRGFTLVELLIAMAVGLIVLGAVYALFTAQSKHLANQELLTEMHQNARIAMGIMAQEISMAGYNQTTAPTITAVNRCTGTTTAATNPCIGITYAGNDTIKFAADLNGNGSITPDDPSDGDNANENIAYDADLSLGVKSLRRNSKYTKSGSSYQPVVENVESLNFIYYDGAGSITANLANIRSVKITIVTRTAKDDPSYTDANGHHHHHYTLSSFCVIRNLGL